MKLTPQKYQALEEEFNELFQPTKHFLSQEDRAGIQHYVDHAELEMAFESLWLTLMQKRPRLSAPIRARAERLGLELGLNTETVFDTEFWSSFVEYIQED